MKKKNVFGKKIYGIRGRFLKYVLTLLILAMVLSALGVGAIIGKNVNRTTIEKYVYVNERIAALLEKEFEKTDALMKRCIESKEIQNSLLSHELNSVEKANLEAALSYIDLKHLENYIYIDNKNNVYQQAYRSASYAKVAESGLKEALGEEYSATKWIWTKDNVFDEKGNYLFVGRYMRNMDYHHAPGMLFFQLNGEFFQTILKDVSEEEAVCMILDEKGKLCANNHKEDNPFTKKQMKKLRAEIEKKKTDGTTNSRFHLRGMGTVIYQKTKGSGFTAVTVVPASISNTVLFHTLFILLCVYAAVVFVAVVFSLYFSKRFTSPIQEISEAMKQFDGGDFSGELVIKTDTELDTIGNAFHKMVKNIEQLVTEIKENEKQLRQSELNSLMYQINPHFLYNTLDTIYMLARINKEETTMKMIQALSNFLKISLSKGSDEITVAEELEHVKSYMEIQKIRNNDLFQYEIICDETLKNKKTLKLILQPIVENAIKHGFAKMYDGGEIRICVSEEETDGGHMLVFRVSNNGAVMDEEVRELIADMVKTELSLIRSAFQGQENGYGIGNIISRLRLKYGDGIVFTYESDEKETCCIIKIPLQEEL